MSLESLADTRSEELARNLASSDGGIYGQRAALAHFNEQKVQRESEARLLLLQKEREREAERKKEKEREKSREAQRSREKIKAARREKLETDAAERRIANKVLDRAVALETLRDRRAASVIAELNRNLRAALRPGANASAPSGSLGPRGPLGPLGRGGPYGPIGPSKIYDDDDDDYYDDDDGEDEGAFAFNTACEALSANGECDSRAMQRYPPTKSVCWVHETPPASAYGSMISSIVEFWRKTPSDEHESKSRKLYRIVFKRYVDEGRMENPISIAAKVVGACIYVWGSTGGAARWTVHHHDETGECSRSNLLSSGSGIRRRRAPVYLVMYATSTPGRYRYARIKPHIKGSTLPSSLVH